MPNLGQTQAWWKDTFTMFCTLLSIAGSLRMTWFAYRNRRTLTKEEHEQALQFSSWTFAGIDLGINTDENGQLYTNVTVVGPNVTVDCYRDPAKAAGDRVLTGTVAFPGTITLAEVNDSNASGSVVVGAAPVNDTDIVLTTIQDFPLRLANAFPVEDQETDDAATDLKALVKETFAEGARSNFEDFVDEIEDYLTSGFADRVNAPEDVRADGSITYEMANDDGVVTVDKELGVLKHLRDSMNDETVAGAQTIKKNVVTFGSLVADADNVGTGALGTIAGRSHMFSGTLRVKCVDETGGTEGYSVTHELAEPEKDGTSEIVGEETLTIKRSYADGFMGLSGFTLNRGTPVESGDAGNILANYTTSGESSTNTNDGIIYWRVTRLAGDNWQIDLFSDAARTLMVAQATTPGLVGVVNLTANPTGGSGLSSTFDFDKAAAAAALGGVGNTQDSQINLKFGKEGDEYTIAVTNNKAGKIATLVGQLFHTDLNETAGAPTIDDGLGTVHDLIQSGA